MPNGHKNQTFQFQIHQKTQARLEIQLVQLIAHELVKYAIVKLNEGINRRPYARNY